ncbi:MAG: nucleoside triphosphate pyrophosphohydrolase [Patescibacteria group bacterium]|jgi:predicted house-cleaning noncanonical NTP pyrophosphatase (MazG superfamily)
MKHDKLVRDRIPEIIKAKGQTATFREVSVEEYGERLVDKLREEVEEFARDRNAEELADILEVVKAICAHHGFDEKEVEAVRVEKGIERGIFEKRIVLESVE